jgi:hypothetical protein
MPARADFGPRPNDRQRFDVTLEGGPLPDAEFVAAMLCLSPELKDEPDNMGAVVPGLKAALPRDDSGGGWTYAAYKCGGQGADGHVEFHGFYGDVPGRFRVAVYLPSQDKLFLSNEAHTHPLLSQFRVDLASDGTATLTRDESGRWLADALVAFVRRGILVALGTTVVIELVVVALAVTRLKKRELLWRLTLVCLAVNLLTVPIVWVIGSIGFWLIGLWAGLLLLVVLELVAVCLEGVAYATVGRLGWRPALVLAVLANAASFLLGLVDSSGTVA